MFLLLYFYLFNTFGSSTFASQDVDTLKSVSVVFRHGDRLPDPYPQGFYPNDPYLNYSFDPLELGDLTNIGRKRMYDFGTFLRGYYGKFLGDHYKSSDVFVVSSNYERTKMSLLLTLAGLYPPKSEQIWHEDISWQPIPIHFLPPELVSYMMPYDCPEFDKELRRVMKSRDYQKEIYKFKDLMKNLTIITGSEMSEIKYVIYLFQTLGAEEAMNLTLPEWTKAYYPDKFIEPIKLYYKLYHYNAKLNKLNGGLLIRKILNSMVGNPSRNISRENKKLFLYSGHDVGVASLLKALNLWNNNILNYASALIFELHEKNSKYYFKILFYKGIPAEIEEQIIPNCSLYCPVDDFVSLHKEIIPDDVIEACFGPSSNSSLVPKIVDKNAWIYSKISEWFNI